MSKEWRMGHSQDCLSPVHNSLDRATTPLKPMLWVIINRAVSSASKWYPRCIESVLAEITPSPLFKLLQNNLKTLTIITNIGPNHNLNPNRHRMPSQTLMLGYRKFIGTVCCRHKVPPVSTVFCSPPSSVQTNVGRFQIILNSSSPCIFFCCPSGHF